MRDFTFKTYRKLLEQILASGYEIQRFDDFLTNPKEKAVVLRHDSDIWPNNDLIMSKVEDSLNVNSTYYFRVPETFNETIISEIKNNGHEIGYHYEELARHNGNYEIAIKSFEEKLNTLNSIAEIKTFVRHGRPLSKIESLDMWKKYDYKKYGLIGEPYLDVDYSKVLYLTDNGNKWNSNKTNIRDKVNADHKFDINSTFDLIDNFKKQLLPNHIILNIHPARWNNNYLVWTYRFFLQKTKNIAKILLNMLRNKK